MRVISRWIEEAYEFSERVKRQMRAPDHARGPEPVISFVYTNHSGLVERRDVSSPRLRVQAHDAEWYPGAWVVHGVCEARNAPRDFLVENIEVSAL